MHIPDGYLGPETYGGLWAAMVPFWLIASRRVKQQMEAAQIPFMAMASSFSLLVMLFSIPLPGGTTGHITGSPLVAICLGPWAGALAVSVALGIQAFLFGDGGITTLGANCFNIALSGSFVAYGIYRLITMMGLKIFGEKPSLPDPEAPSPPPLAELVGVGAGTYIAVNVGALFGALELGLQPLIHKGPGGGASYFPFHLDITLPAILIPHLTAVGGLEVIVTMGVWMFLKRIKPGMSRGFRSILFISFLVLFLLPAESRAHEFWIEQKGKEFTLVYGHGSHREAFDAGKIKQGKAFDSEGREMAVFQGKKGKEIFLKTLESPALMVAEIDNGYWSKTIYGWKNLPKRKASRVVEATRSWHYSKAIISWSDIFQKPVEGVALDIIPLKNPFEMKGGEMLPVQIIHQKRPLAGVELFGNDHTKVGATDSQGIAKVVLSKGHQRITVTFKEALKDDPDADSVSVTTTLTFEVTK